MQPATEPTLALVQEKPKHLGENGMRLGAALKQAVKAAMAGFAVLATILASQERKGPAAGVMLLRHHKMLHREQPSIAFLDSITT